MLARSSLAGYIIGVFKKIINLLMYTSLFSLRASALARYNYNFLKLQTKLWLSKILLKKVVYISKYPHIPRQRDFYQRESK